MVADAIGDGNRRFMDAVRNRDPAAAAACYTPDAQLLPPHSDFVSGTNAIAEYWRSVMGMGIAAVRLETAELETYGDAAVEVGRYTLNAADGTLADRGKYLVLWRQRDGAWLIHRDIWSTSQPATTH
jgi:uncharacterized protein (TIGR02246 family)